MTRGIPPERVLKSVAAGWRGPQAFKDGPGMAALGLATHFSIALVMAAVFVLAATRVRELVRLPFVWGPLYGVALWLTMRFVVLPLTVNPPKSPPQLNPITAGDIISHMALATIIALFARRALLARR